jgi:hypothetical protein
MSGIKTATRVRGDAITNARHSTKGAEGEQPPEKTSSPTATTKRRERESSERDDWNENYSEHARCNALRVRARDAQAEESVHFSVPKSSGTTTPF